MNRYLLILLLFLLSGCAPTRNYMKKPEGVVGRRVLIKTQPTKARIFVEDVYIGMTPLRTTLWYEKEKFINVRAEPVYQNQMAQNIYLRIPPIPRKFTIYMNYDYRRAMLLAGEDKPVSEPLVMEPEVIRIIEKEIVEQERPFILPSIFFATDSYDLTANDLLVLKELAEMLISNQDFFLTINAHADIRGGRDYNYELSYNRGMAVRGALLSFGVKEGRLNLLVHGAREVLDEQRELIPLNLNRVVDFQIQRGK